MLLGAAIGEIMPEPTDPIFIWLTDWLKVHQAEIPVWQYWGIWVFNYYVLSAIWYLVLLALVLGLDVTVHERVFLITGLLSAGAVIGLAGYLISGRGLPGVENLGLGYLITFASIGAFAGLGSFVLFRLQETRLE